MDDVIIFGSGKVEEWKELDRLLKIFYKAYGRQLNLGKLFSIFNEQEKNIEDEMIEIFPVQSSTLGSRFKYLGYLLKPNYYYTYDW